MPDDEELYVKVGHVIMEFINNHQPAFPNALLSKKDFWNVLPWRRAMVFVFLCRHVFNMSGHQQWCQFSLFDYKFNVRMFNKWLAVETKVLSVTPQYIELSAECSPSKRKQRGRGRKGKNPRKNETSGTDSPPQMQVIVGDDFTDDEGCPELAFSTEDSGDDDDESHEAEDDVAEVFGSSSSS